jgi:hypothetical protein
MIGQRTRFAIRALHWTVGLVVLLESCLTFHGAQSSLHDLGHSGALAWVRLVLSGSEIFAALLFLIPFTSLVGGYLLLVIFTLAIAIHSLHGDFAGLEILVLYGVAVFVSLADRRDRALPPSSKIQ